MDITRLAGAGAVIGLVPLLTAVTAVLVSRGLCTAEAGRKALHVGLGSAAISLPWTIGSAAAVVTGALLASLWFLGVRRIAALRRSLGPAIHGVERRSSGEFYFVAGVGLTYVIARGDALLYCLPVAILVFADSSAALVGQLPRSRRYPLGNSGKTWAGTAAFFAVSLFVSAVGLAVFPHPALPSMPLAFLVALNATLLELYGKRGADNVLIPLGVVTLLLGLQWNALATLAANGAALWLCAPDLIRRFCPVAQP